MFPDFELKFNLGVPLVFVTCACFACASFLNIGSGCPLLSFCFERQNKKDNRYHPSRALHYMKICDLFFHYFAKNTKYEN